MTDPAEHHQKRAEDMGDTIRRYLIGINAGGVGVLAAIARGDSSPRHLWFPILSFVIGLGVTGLSLFIQKHKALKRRDAARTGQPEPDFNKFWSANETYDLISFACFVTAVFSYFYI